jgi:hypothetical protein
VRPCLDKKNPFEKCYEKLDKNFFFQVLLMKGFAIKFVHWVKVVVNDGSVVVMINDQMGPYFKTLRVVKHWGSLSPVLFDLVVDVLAILINRASELVEGGVVMLQYADDTIFLSEDDTESAINLKVILIIFGHMSSLKINFLKSEVCCFGQYCWGYNKWVYQRRSPKPASQGGPSRWYGGLPTGRPS